jgi:hypothetical protein
LRCHFVTHAGKMREYLCFSADKSTTARKFKNV